MSFLDDIGDAVGDAWSDVTEKGAPAIIAGVEQYAAQQLQGAARQNQAAVTKAINQSVKSGQPSKGVMASIQNVLSGIGQSVVVKQYGVYIVLGVVGIVILARAKAFK